LKKPDIKKRKPEFDFFSALASINEKLNESVLGQEEAKSMLSVAGASHLLHLVNPKHSSKKNNILLVGESGTGKTELATAFAKALDVPFVAVDCTRLTPHGYVGEDIESCLSLLLDSVGGDINQASRGVIFLDEFDKITMGGEFESSYGVNKKLQAEFLKILEGSIVELKPSGPLNLSSSVKIDTSNILFIAAGTFSGTLDDSTNAADREIGIVNSYGEGGSRPVQSSDTCEGILKDLYLRGIMPELIGRFSMACKTRPLSKDILKKIAARHISSSRVLSALSSSNTAVHFSEEFIDDLIERSNSLKLGVRGIQSLIESSISIRILDITKYCGQTITVTLDGVMLGNQQASAVGQSELLTESPESVATFVKEKTVFSKLNQNAISDLLRNGGKVVKFFDGEVIGEEGESGADLLVLLSGKIRVINEKGLNILRDNPGMLFGELSFFDNKKRSATMIATGSVEMIKIDYENLRSIIESNPAAGCEVIQAMSQSAVNIARESTIQIER
jgi:ATP-dependent Clp protease ATP-binding subunit ClpX